MADVSKEIEDMLSQEGDDIIAEIQDNLASTGTNATGATSKSLRKEVEVGDRRGSLSIFGRGYIFSVETGRGPRKSSTKSNFLDGMMDWMKIRGIGTGLDNKKFEQLARFFTWRQNTLGSVLFRKGGRKDIITPAISQETVDRIGDRAAKIYADNIFKVI